MMRGDLDAAIARGRDPLCSGRLSSQRLATNRSPLWPFDSSDASHRSGGTITEAG